jgi:hypothetical protein
MRLESDFRGILHDFSLRNAMFRLSDLFGEVHKSFPGSMRVLLKYAYR